MLPLANQLALGNDFCMSYGISLDLAQAKAILQSMGYKHMSNLPVNLVMIHILCPSLSRLRNKYCISR